MSFLFEGESSMISNYKLDSEDEKIIVMINEEDHIREQCLENGFNLYKPFRRLSKIDDEILSTLPIAFDNNLGFITASPSNLGTGMRASVMLFLPACDLLGKMDEIFAKDVEKFSEQEIEKLMQLKDKLLQNLSILERNFAKLAENMNALLSDFNKTKNAFKMAKEQFSVSKQNYDKAVEEAEPKKQEISKKLASLEKGIDAKIIDAYKKRRNENIFPVVVALAGNCCGGCRVELSMANLSKLKEDKILTCEHCHRIIYVK